MVSTKVMQEKIEFARDIFEDELVNEIVDEVMALSNSELEIAVRARGVNPLLVAQRGAGIDRASADTEMVGFQDNIARDDADDLSSFQVYHYREAQKARRTPVVKSFDPASLFERIAKPETLRLIAAVAGNRSDAIPVDPGQDPSERLIRSNAANWIAAEVQPIAAGAAKSGAEIVATNIPADEPANIRSRAGRDLDLLCEAHKRQSEERNRAINHHTVALRALRGDGSVKPGPRAKFRRHWFHKVAALGAGETIYNGVSLFITGYLGGLAQTVGLAAIVTLVNLLAGFLFGDVVARGVRRRETDWPGGLLSWALAVGLLLIALLNNLAMASLQAFAKEGVTALWSAPIGWQFSRIVDGMEPTAGLIGAASAVVGLIVVFLVARMWLPAETRKIDALEAELARRRHSAAQGRCAFSEAAIDLAEHNKKILDELYGEAFKRVSGVSRTLAEFERDFAECESRQYRIKLAHEGAAELHRQAVRNALPGMELPAYFDQRVDYDGIVVPVTGADAARDHVGHLQQALPVLEQRVMQAKSDVERDLKQILGMAGPAAEQPTTQRPAIPGRRAARRTFLSTVGGRIAAVIVVSGALGSIVYGSPKLWDYVMQNTERQLDACAQTPARVDAIVVDASDPVIAAAQRAERDMLIDNFLKSSEYGRRIIVARLTGEPRLPLELVYQGCDSGRAKQPGVVFNTKAAEQRRSEYVENIEDAISRAYISPGRPMTPLIEGLGQLFRKQEFYGQNANVAKRVLLLTDTLQNSGKVTAYPVKKRRAAVQSRLTDPQSRRYVDSFRTEVSNTEITVGCLYRPNLKELQSFEHKTWFKTFLASNGARVKWVEVR